MHTIDELDDIDALETHIGTCTEWMLDADTYEEAEHFNRWRGSLVTRQAVLFAVREGF